MKTRVHTSHRTVKIRENNQFRRFACPTKHHISQESCGQKQDTTLKATYPPEGTIQRHKMRNTANDAPYAKIPKLYHAYELRDENEQLHVFDSEKTLEDAEKSRLKMNEFQKDEKVQELKIKPIDYGKLNKLYNNFVPQKELSAEQTYFSSSFISSEEFSSETKPSMASMPSANPMLVDLNEMENVFKKLFELLEKNSKRASIFYTSPEELRLIDVCVEAKFILQELHLYFEIFQN
ncbi:hypothetical protein Tco_0210107 [Tanacetum coccineum]